MSQFEMWARGLVRYCSFCFLWTNVDPNEKYSMESCCLAFVVVVFLLAASDLKLASLNCVYVPLYIGLLSYSSIYFTKNSWFLVKASLRHIVKCCLWLYYYLDHGWQWIAFMWVEHFSISNIGTEPAREGAEEEARDGGKEQFWCHLFRGLISKYVVVTGKANEFNHSQTGNTLWFIYFR